MNKILSHHLMRQMIPNLGTLIVVALMLFASKALAAPAAAPVGPNVTPGVISYQGTLADASGQPVSGQVEMTFSLYSVPIGGAYIWQEAHTASNAVPVNNGLFNALLGSLTPIPPEVWNNNAVYLGVQVGTDPEMTPRELIGSVPVALVANTALSVPNGSITRSKLSFDPWKDVQEIRGVVGGTLYLIGDSQSYTNTWAKSGIITLSSVNHSVPDWRGTVRVSLMKDLNVGNSPYFDIQKLQSDGTSVELFKVSESGSVSMNGWDFIMGANERGDGGRALVHSPGDGLIINYANDFPGGVNIMGTLTTNAVAEANLLTAQEQALTKIERFDEGDLLCWGDGQLEKCSQADDKLVQAVADPNGKPIVMGAEVIKVIGPVHRGDLLVASGTPGYAMVNNNPLPGTVIAQALEDFDGPLGLIKAMIRKF